jgi:hypothetical protein
MAKSPFEIVLSDNERIELERRVACYTTPFKVVQRFAKHEPHLWLAA